MSEAYLRARGIALGLSLGRPPVEVGASIWDVGQGQGMAADLPFQFFERQLQAPGESVAHRSALSLYEDEYSADCGAAVKRLEELHALLLANDAPKTEQFLALHPLEEWFSFVFLDEGQINGMVEAIRNIKDLPMHHVVITAVGQSLERLKNYRMLLETLLGILQAEPGR
ncbi:MAG: hypothetical protein PHN46_05425 [Eubacteriales bacterium]|nr:hypothetical protein [Eubacteriales bacterium]